MVRGLNQHTLMASKRVERWYLEQSRLLCPAFPEGDISESECPDFIISAPDATVGIEITKLYQQASGGEFEPREVEAFRERVIRDAATAYGQRGYPPVDVLAFFPSYPGPRQNANSLAEAIADFVGKKYSDADFVMICDRRTDPDQLPSGIELIRIAAPMADVPPRWQASAVGETVPLTNDFLAEVISKKETLVPQYRIKAQRVWLLVVIDLFPSSANFSVPRDIGTWSFPTDFDEVFLFCREDSQLWALRGS